MSDLRPLHFPILALLLLLPGIAHPQDPAEKRENMYLSGTEVRPPGPVSGDLVAAAGRIAVDHYVRGDAVLAAGTVEIRGSVGEDLRVAGGVVTLTKRVGGEALIGGWNIAFGPDAESVGQAWIAGLDVAIAGRFRQGVTVYAKHLLVLAEIDGDVRLVGETVEILPAARIKGNVTYKSRNEIKVHPAAQVGTIVREPGTFPKFRLPGWPAFRPLLAFGLLAAGALLLHLFPRFTTSAFLTVGAAPLKSLGLGTAIFFSAPPVILLLVITIIGIPLALAAAALYALALLTGYLVGAYSVGNALLRTVRKNAAAGYWLRVGSFAVALVVLWMVRHLPYAGGLLILLLVIVGLGAMVLQAFTSYQDGTRPSEGRVSTVE